MEIYPLGHASFRIKGKNATVVTDPFDPEMVGLKFAKLETVDLVTISHPHPDHNFLQNIPGAPFVISGPGEYEVKGVTVVGVKTFHDDKGGTDKGNNTVYKMVVDDVRICHLGDLGHKLTDEQLDQIGEVDILFVPVGGFYTINSNVASEVVAQIEPLVVIPMHYGRAGLNPKQFSELETVDKFLSEMGSAGTLPVNKYSTAKDKLPENTTVIVLE